MTRDEYMAEAFRLKPYLIRGLMNRYQQYADAESIVLETIQMAEKHCEKLPVRALIAYLTTACRWRTGNTMRTRMHKQVNRTSSVSDIEEPFTDKYRSAIDEDEQQDACEFIFKI